MKLGRLLNELSYGELKGTSLINIGTYKIRDNSIPVVITALNNSLIQIFTEFPIKHKSVLINLIPGKKEYHIAEKHIMDELGNGYIFPTIDPDDCIQDDLIQIVSVSYGEELLKLNEVDLKRNDSIFITGVNRISIPAGMRYPQLTVTYQACHKYIEPCIDYDPNTEIDIPKSLEPYLKLHIAVNILRNQTNAIDLQNLSILTQLLGAKREEIINNNIGYNSISYSSYGITENGMI